MMDKNKEEQTLINFEWLVLELKPWFETHKKLTRESKSMLIE